MVTRLRLTRPLHANETIFSFVGALARLNHQPSTTNFCDDMGASFIKICHGDTSAIDRIAYVARVDHDQLRSCALLKGDGKTALLAGQKTSVATLLTGAIRYCPACIVADSETGAVHGRRHWLVQQYATCHLHQMELVTVPAHSHRAYDFQACMWNRRQLLHDEITGSSRREATALELYVKSRIEVGRGSSWLDDLGFSAAVRFCEVLGAVRLHGAAVSLKRLDDAALREAGEAGFRIAAEGRDAVKAFFAFLQKQDGRDSRVRAHADLGAIHVWLMNSKDADTFPLAELVAEHVGETMPVGPGEKVLGIPVRVRKLHSIWTASQRYGINAKSLRSYLIAAGVIEDDSSAYDHHVLFDAVKNAVLLERLSRAKTAKNARQIINCERQQFPLLVKAGLLTPIVESDAVIPLFDTVDLAGFVSRLAQNSESVSVKPAGMETIATARLKLNCGQIEIVHLILAGKVRTAKLREVIGYAGMLVDPTEVRQHLTNRGIKGIGISNIASDFGIPHQAVVSLLGDLLPWQWETQPTRRDPRMVVSQADYAEFKSRYVSLRDLAREAGIHSKAMLWRLNQQGVPCRPGLPRKTFLYDRRHL